MSEIADRMNDEDLERIKAAVRTLGEFFDTVQIFATKPAPDGGGTVHMAWGYGNFFARYGHVIQWLRKENRCIDMEVSAHE